MIIVILGYFYIKKKFCIKIEENVEILNKRILINDGVWLKMLCLKV